MLYRRGLLGCLTIALLTVGPLAAQDEEKELGWFDSAELSLFMTDGNAESQSLALRNTLRRVWTDASFELAAGALRAEQATISRVAQGTPEQFEVVESSQSEVTAENYFVRGRYEKETTDSYFWFAGAGWERNEFTGIANRIVVVGGVGTIWYQRDDGYFKTDYGVTYTDQEDVVENPDVDESFVGIRLSWDYGRALTATTDYGNQLIVDANVDETSDYRADMVNSLTVAMSAKMALKMSLQFLYDNDPALAEVPLLTPVGEVATVVAPLDELDTLLTASLVVAF